ncbi:hypothetical protein [Motilibacter aurantiacus]|nr:hypothetical protein [Motilibacter aurantiacus]NHC46501.1 hypothetical protein [Motilibacter aurantiacus]
MTYDAVTRASRTGLEAGARADRVEQAGRSGRTPNPGQARVTLSAQA